MRVSCDETVHFDATIRVDDGGRITLWFKNHEITSYVEALNKVLEDAAGQDNGSVIEVECEAECSAVFGKGTRDYFDGAEQQWMPGDPSFIEDLTVMVGDVDVAEYITQYQTTAIEERLVEIGLEES
jgi:hypothetical protein